MDDCWGDFTFDESQTFTNKFLNLPNSIMENICRFLSTKDQYNACLIHPNWTTAAQTVLWEKPRFEAPASFRDFMNTIRTIRKVSLLVQDVYLIFLDRQTSIFQPIVKSNTERHRYEHNALSSLNFVGAVSKTCEHLKSVSFYGWHIEHSWIEKLPMLATELTSLYIIGANLKTHAPLVLAGLLSRLTSLRLDGAFTVDDKWVDALVMRGKMIQQLQLPLQKIPVTTLSRICAPGGLTALCDLTLTDADYLLDQHVKHIALSFPHLRKLCLEGTKQVTILSIAHMFSTCPQLISLEIRAHFQSLDIPVSEHSISAFNDLMMYNQTCAAPVRLLLENLNIDDHRLATLAPHLHLIQTLGFKSCPLVTSEGLKSTVESMKYLRLVHILNCMNIDSSFFSKFAGMGNIVKTLSYIHYESSGTIDPRHIYEICRAGIEYNLRQIRFVGYFELQTSAVGNFNEEYGNTRNEDQSIVTLNRTSIDALAHSNDPEFSSIPNSRTLTGKQIIRLAKNLDLSVQELLSMIDDSQESDYDDDDFVTEEEEYNKPRNSKSISFSNTAMDSDISSSNNRLYALKHQNSSQRPTTPALWSNDFEENNVLYSDESQSEKSSNDETSGFTEEENTDEYVEDEDDKEDKEEDGEGANSPKWASLGPASAQNTGSEISLGGWGVTSGEGWVAHGKPHSSEHPIANPVIPRTVTPPPQQQQQQWTGYTEEIYKDQWQQTGLEYNAKNMFNGRNKQKHFRNSPVVSDNDGWGSAQAIIPWDDVRAQGFVKSVIEEQKNTTFWTQTDDGNWKRAHDPTPKPTAISTRPAPSRENASNGSPTLLFSDIASGLHNSKANQGIPITQSHRGKNNHPNHHSNRPAPAAATPSRLRSDSLISSDGSVCWTDDSHAHIKLSSKEPSPTQNAAVTSSSSTPRFSTPKASESTSRTKWNSADEWKNIKESSNDNTITEQSSWQDHFSPAAIADKTAKNEWKNFSRPRTSTPTRPSAPPREIDTRWGAFSNNNGNNVSPPSRNLTSSPPRNGVTNSNNYQKPSTPAAAPISQDLLVDTTNINATPTRPLPKGDVWESLSSLDVPVTRSPQPVLVPQGASGTKPSAAPIPTEISNWSPLGSDSSKDQDDVPNFRFQETISGTITEREVQDQIEAQKNDNLVDFEVLISSSAPVMSPNFSNASVLASPVPSNPKVSSDLLNMDQIETATTASTSSNLTDFTSLMAEAKESVTKKNTNDTAADDLTALNTHMNGTTTTTTTTATSEVTNTTAPAVAATAAPLNDFSSLMSNSKPAEISSPASASGLNTPTYTNANASSKEDVAYTSDPSPRSTPEIQEKKPNLIKLRVQIEGKGSIQLALDCSKDFKEAIQNFCDEHGVPQYFEALHKQATDRWTARETKKILGKAKKKKVTSTASPTPSSLF